MTASPLKYHGAKSPLARRIVAAFPPRRSEEHPEGWLHYVEPFFGGGSILLAQEPEGISEVANDLDSGLSNFWRVLQSPEAFPLFVRRLSATPFSELEYERACRRILLHDVDVDAACGFFVHCRQSLAGRMKGFAPLSRARVRRGMNEQAAAWLSAVEGLPEVHARLKRVVVLNKPALDVIRSEDSPSTLHVCDPPYLPETRTAPKVYRHEMTRDQHAELLEVLKGCAGKVVLCGYPNPLYDEALRGWRVVDFARANSAAGGKKKRRMVERLWVRD